MPWMSIVVFTRVVFASTIFAMYKYMGFLVFLIIVSIRLVFTKVLWRTMSFENNLLGALTSITAPCLLLKDNSNYFWMTNYIIGESLSSLIVWITYLLAKSDFNEFTKYLFGNTIFQCQDVQLDYEVTLISRCVLPDELNNTNGICQPGLLPLTGHYSYTACPLESEEWLPLFYHSILLTIFQFLSLASILVMNYLSDPLQRLQLSLFFNKYTGSNFPILWRQEDQDWIEEAKLYIEGKLPRDDDRLLHMLKAAINSKGFLRLIKVNSTRNMHFK